MLLSIRLSMLWKILPMDNRIGLSRKGLGVVAASRAWTGYTGEKDPFLFVFRARILRNNKVNGKKKRKKKRRKKSLKPVTPENRFQRLLPSKVRCKQLASRAYFTERVSQWYTGRESFITHRVRTANFRKKSTLFLFFQPSPPP